MSHVLVCVGGIELTEDRLADIPRSFDRLIAVDAGAHLAHAAGLSIDVLVGDLDSIGTELLDQLRHQGCVIEEHSPNKDQTDLELGLVAAVASDPSEMTIAGGGGGRADHFLANAAVIASPAWRRVPIAWILESETVYPVHGRRIIDTSPDATISVLPIGGDAHGVTLTGVEWPLDNATMGAHSSLGVSNRALGNSVAIDVTNGTVLAIVNRD